MLTFRVRLGYLTQVVFTKPTFSAFSVILFMALCNLYFIILLMMLSNTKQGHQRIGIFLYTPQFLLRYGDNKQCTAQRRAWSTPLSNTHRGGGLPDPEGTSREKAYYKSRKGPPNRHLWSRCNISLSKASLDCVFQIYQLVRSRVMLPVSTCLLYTSRCV